MFLLLAVPYVILELEDQFADSGAELVWRCEAGGNPEPSYFWLKNGVVCHMTLTNVRFQSSRCRVQPVFRLLLTLPVSYLRYRRSVFTLNITCLR